MSCCLAVLVRHIAIMRMIRCQRLLHECGSAAIIVIRTAERHRHGSSRLRGNRKHQQPDEKRSDQRGHEITLPQ